ncbi:MFS transporter [Streptomyces sp. RB6PN25]|uniref:MFS transporter n=1 Tax=Streptomyces humicola TaxID=2953240 RepID=A0ABT1PVU4_9ACTN|nr:MFS transporter [Streptomyces humicola]MCQ4081796.1 MFS transporter [Streptomyces humicola]
MAVVRDLRVLVRLRDFRRLLVVRLLSQLSDGVYQVALAAYVVFTPQKQASATAIAAAMAVLLLPYSLVGPFTGVLLDRWRRRQVLLYCNVARAVLAACTAGLILARAPDWLFYLSALAVTGINRFVLAGLSAALPRVVDGERLVIANSVSPTAGTIAATAGGAAAFLVHLVMAAGVGADAVVVGVAAVLYLGAGLSARTMPVGLLGPDPGALQPRIGAALASTAFGLVEGVRHLAERRPAAYSLGAITVMRFCYGALTVTLLILARYLWSPPSDTARGLALFGLAVGVSGAGFFAAAVTTPWGAGRFGRTGWIVVCAASSTVLEPALGLPFEPGPMLAAAFLLGLTTQGAKIATDTVVQTSIDDSFRGRVFSIYDMLFNVAFVISAGVAALLLPADGRSPQLLIVIAVLYGAVAAAMARFRRTRHAPTTHPARPAP